MNLRLEDFLQAESAHVRAQFEVVQKQIEALAAGQASLQSGINDMRGALSDRLVIQRGSDGSAVLGGIGSKADSVYSAGTSPAVASRGCDVNTLRDGCASTCASVQSAGIGSVDANCGSGCELGRGSCGSNVDSSSACGPSSIAARRTFPQLDLTDTGGSTHVPKGSSDYYYGMIGSVLSSRGRDGADMMKSPKRSKSVYKMKQEERRIHRLRRIFSIAKYGPSERSEQRSDMKSHLDRLRSRDIHEIEIVADAFMGLVILANSIFIGVALDHNNGEVGWLVCNVLFSLLFLCELAFKICAQGFVRQFCGPSWLSNGFDAFLIVADAIQVSLDLMVPETAKTLEEEGIPAVSLFRVVRLLRLARVLRLFRSAGFRDLQSMILGMMGGLMTLGWAVILFLLIIYVAALLCKEALGKRMSPNVFEYFDSVPRAMLTVFRCSFGDCSSSGGVPIFEHVHESYGGFISFVYCAFTFFVTVGLFNVISAIFVDSTVRATEKIETDKLRQRLSDEQLWSSSVYTLLSRSFVAANIELKSNLEDEEGLVLTTEFDREIVDKLVEDSEAIAALQDLDIDPDDHRRLSDILDPDHSGTIGILEMIEGLRRLRGQPRRSDIVTVDLMVRALQTTAEEINHTLNRSCESQRRFFDDVLDTMQHANFSI
eukprot:TRINITY_DN26748_c0_g3_i2.p1 TRINITY_DN26748_c0_g3~~TRINITY_DN26748_c0_g3_i2.p1  ORF type:complete len:683 (+),score=82.29 TRINITY_DN26748_c0_g3_i2:81-2051(+)